METRTNFGRERTALVGKLVPFFLNGLDIGRITATSNQGHQAFTHMSGFLAEFPEFWWGGYPGVGRRLIFTAEVPLSD
jgi:hypothetical protein